MQLAELERPISDIVPHIFKRPILSVKPEDSLLYVGTFLATGPQIYVDGLVVVHNQKPVGRIGGQHLVQHILQHQKGWQQATAFDIMNHPSRMVYASDPLHAALRIFSETKFAFVPVTVDNSLATSLSVRDVLGIVANSRLDTAIGELSSRLVSIKHNTSIEKALQVMLQNGIRNLAVRNEKNDTRIINDRKILEFLVSYEGRRVIASPMGLDAVSVDFLDMPNARYVKRSMSADIAAEYLSNINTPCLLFDDSIVTPWDIVIKGLFKV